MLLRGNLRNNLKGSNFPVSSRYHDSASIALYILEIHHFDIKLCCEQMNVCCALKYPCNWPHDYVKYKRKKLFTNIISEERSSFHKKAKHTRETRQQQKLSPTPKLHTLTFAAWLHSGTRHPLAPHIPPGWSRFFQLTVQTSSPKTQPPSPWHQLHLILKRSANKRITCERKMNAYPGDKRARHELLQEGCEYFVLHFTEGRLTST